MVKHQSKVADTLCVPCFIKRYWLHRYTISMLYAFTKRLMGKRETSQSHPTGSPLPGKFTTSACSGGTITPDLAITPKPFARASAMMYASK